MNQSIALDMRFAGLTDVGRTRSRNEDCFNVSIGDELAVVCDGMGGHAGGDIASRTAADAIADFIAEFHPDPSADTHRNSQGTETTLSEADMDEPTARNALSITRSAVQLANQRLVGMNQERGMADGRGMGTTVVGLWRVPGGSRRLVVFHAGDSRAYRWRNGELRQLTRDHSLYQLWLDNGSRGPAPHRNVIVRALGTSLDVEPEVALQDVEPDDLFLLCSDGLTGMLTDGVIAETLARRGQRSLEDMCAVLVTLANDLGGRDNITVVLGQAEAR